MLGAENIRNLEDYEGNCPGQSALLTFIDTTGVDTLSSGDNTKVQGRGDDRELDNDCGRNCSTHRKVHPDVLLDLLAMSATFEKPLDTSVEGNEATKDKDK